MTDEQPLRDAARFLLGAAKAYLYAGAEPERLAEAIYALEGVLFPVLRTPPACVHPYHLRSWEGVRERSARHLIVAYRCSLCGEAATMVLPPGTPRPEDQPTAT